MKHARHTFVVFARLNTGMHFHLRQFAGANTVARYLATETPVGRYALASVHTNSPLYIYAAWWPKCFVNEVKKKKKK